MFEYIEINKSDKIIINLSYSWMVKIMYMGLNGLVMVMSVILISIFEKNHKNQ